MSVDSLSSSNFGSASLNVAMTKRATDQEGAVAMSLLAAAVSSADSIMAQGAAISRSAPSPVPSGTTSVHIDTYA